MSGQHIKVAGVFGLIIVALAYLASTDSTHAQLYFAAIGLLVITGAVIVLASLSLQAEAADRRSYFGVIATLLASLAGLAAGVAGGAVAGSNATSEVNQQAADIKQQVQSVQEDVSQLQPATDGGQAGG